MTWEAILPLIIAALPATIAAIAAWFQSRANGRTTRALEIRVDGRLTELLELNRKEAGAQATLVEKAAERQRKGDAAIDRANVASPKGEAQ